MDGYFVGVRQAKWPTLESLQRCIDHNAWPVVIGKPDDLRWTRPLETTHGTLGLSVSLRGDPIELETSIITLSSSESFAQDYIPTETSTFDLGIEILGHKQAVIVQGGEFRPLDVNDVLARLGARDVRFEYGDRVLEITFRSSKKERQAGYYIMAALIKCFDGYAFQRHGDRHGRSDFADVLIKEAIELHGREDEPTQPPFLKWQRPTK